MVRQEVIDMVLDPYVPDCRYLVDADYVDGVDFDYEMHSKFSIPKTFYSVNTGHFNATEMMMCYNQMSYVFFADLFERGLIDRMEPISLDDFVDQQVSCLIARMDDIKFKAPINPRDFSGKISLGRRRARGGFGFAETPFSFYDEDGGYASGSVYLVLDFSGKSQTVAEKPISKSYENAV